MIEPTEPKFDPKKFGLYAIIASLLVTGIFGLGYLAGDGRLKVASGRIEITRGDVPSTSADYSLLWDALDVLNNKFVDRPLDQQKLMYGAVQGLVAATGDPYTNFLTPEDSKKFAEQLRGSFGGIGAELGEKNEQLIIIAPLDDTPAQRAGLLAGDVILEIDGESTFGLSIDDAVGKIRGKPGTQVKLKIIHKGSTESDEITVTRAKIEVKSVKFETRQIEGPPAGGQAKKIAVIKLSQFGDDTKGLLDREIDNVTTGGYSGLIIDMRNNPGGYLETAVSTISNWVDEGQTAVKEIGFDNNEKVYSTVGVPRLKGTKTVVLVNGGSASASEIVAGALQDYGVATIVGEKTFGKGSVQELENLKNDSEIKVTVAKWFTPKGRGIDKIGLEPDIKVDLTPEDVTADKDPQMERALDLLK